MKQPSWKNSDTEKTSAEELLQELQRTQEAEKKLEKDLEEFSTPDWATVQMNISPAAIPRETVDAELIASAIFKVFKSRLDVAKTVQSLPPDVQAKVSPKDAIHAAMLQGNIVRFKGGWIAYGEAQQITPIRNFGFGEQTLFASVTGTTNEATYVCKRLATELWHVVGIDRKWAELEDSVEAVSYKTSTMVDLAVPMMELIAQPVQDFLSALCSDGGAARHMGNFDSWSSRHNFFPLAVPYCQEVEFCISLFDETSGAQEECDIDLLLHSRPDANRSRVKVLTELESSKHNEVIWQLAKKLESSYST